MEDAGGLRLIRIVVLAPGKHMARKSGAARLYRDFACLVAYFCGMSLVILGSRWEHGGTRSHLTRYRLTPLSKDVSFMDVIGLRAIDSGS